MSQTIHDDKARYVTRLLAEEDFYFYCRHMFLKRRGYKWNRARHHKMICDALMRVYRGEIKRLIINIPPRYSKTEIAVINFVTWCLAKAPDCEFIHASYSAGLATKNSYQAREMMEHEAYTELFDTRLASDSKAKGDWKTTAGGVMYAVGAEGTITGFGAGKHRPGFGGAIIIDDIHKANEADSEPMRQNVIDWFQNTLESRKNSPDTPIIVVMQRLHQNDLSGWLLDGGNGEEWEHLCLPALQEDGTSLWPEKHSVEDLLRMQEANGYVFSGQYQQIPSPKAGGTFKPDMIEAVDAVPAGIKWVRGWDLAATKKGGDWTVGAKLGVCPDGFIWIDDIVRDRGSPDEVERMLVSTTKADGRTVMASAPQDPGQAGKAQAAYLSRKLAGCSFEFTTESGDKATRASPLAAQVNAGNVRMRKAPWNAALREEMRFFPLGTHDDQIDALSRAYNRVTVKKPVGILMPGAS